MQLAKKQLEKLNRDICLGMAQHGMIELSPKTIPMPHNPQNVPPNQASEFQALWNELHKIQVSVTYIKSQVPFTNLIVNPCYMIEAERTTGESSV